MNDFILSQIVDMVLIQPAHREIYLPDYATPHPRALGFRQDIGEPQGQVADYRLTLGDGRSVHAREYEKQWGFHWDKVDPLRDALEHLRRDSPVNYLMTCAATGAMLGAGLGALTRKKDAAIIGALILGLVGLLFGIITAEWE